MGWIGPAIMAGGMVLSSLMGSKSGGGSRPTTGQVPRYTPEQMELGRVLWNYLRKRPPAPDVAYPGELVADLTQGEMRSLADLENWARSIAGARMAAPEEPGMIRIPEAGKLVPRKDKQGYTILPYPGPTGGAGGLQARTVNALARALSGEPESFEEYYQRAVQEPMLEEFERTIMPAVSKKYAPSGYWSSERVRSEERTRRDLLNALTRARSELAYKARESALERRLKAASLAPELIVLPGKALMSLLEAQALPRKVEQAKRTAAYQEWLRQQAGIDKRIKQMISALGLTPYETYAVAPTSRPGLLESMAPGLGTALGTWALSKW